MKKERFASATIKFLDMDILSGRCEFMVGSRNVTLSFKENQMFRNMETWDSGLEKVAFGDNIVWKFNARNALGAGGVTKAGIIAELMGINGRLI